MNLQEGYVTSFFLSLEYLLYRSETNNRLTIFTSVASLFFFFHLIPVYSFDCYCDRVFGWVKYEVDYTYMNITISLTGSPRRYLSVSVNDRNVERTLEEIRVNWFDPKAGVLRRDYRPTERATHRHDRIYSSLIIRRSLSSTGDDTENQWVIVDCTPIAWSAWFFSEL